MRQKALRAERLGSLHREVPTGENGNLRTDNGVDRSARSCGSGAAVDRVDGTAVKDVAYEQLGLRLIPRRIEEIDRDCGGKAEQRQDRDHFFVPEERKKKIVASETGGRHRF